MTAEPVSHQYVSQRLALHYVDWGNPAAPPLLLIHGRKDHCRSWDWTAQALRRNYHVMALDLRGHGDSAWTMGGGYSFDDFIYDLHQFVVQKGLNGLNIIGHSMGGAVSLSFSGMFPHLVSRLVAIEGTWQLESAMRGVPSTSGEQRLRDWISQLDEVTARQPRRHASLEDAMARIVANNPRLSRDQARHLAEHALRRVAGGKLEWKFDIGIQARVPSRLDKDDTVRLWSRIACPVLMLHGADSDHNDAVTLGYMDYFRQGRAVAIPRAGHWVHHDNFPDFMECAAGFLAG